MQPGGEEKVGTEKAMTIANPFIYEPFALFKQGSCYRKQCNFPVGALADAATIAASAATKFEVFILISYMINAELAFGFSQQAITVSIYVCMCMAKRK